LPVNPELESLLHYLKQSHGFDFTAYKRSSLARRIQRRMSTTGSADYIAYGAFLRSHPPEFDALFSTVLINVTAFFREPAAWAYLGRHVMPQMVASKRTGTRLRVWSAGCATGQEPYSLAMLFAETLGLEHLEERVVVYATDIDEDALAYARAGSYAAKEVDDVPPGIVSKYFTAAGDRFVVNDAVRHLVQFVRSDLVQDNPFGNLDMVVCRNTLMYLTSTVQVDILNRFHAALNEGGTLFLGKAEMLTGLSGRFTPIEPKWRIFAKRTTAPQASRAVRY
jgi:two-component system CheB/CheR fusion protein